MSAAPLKRWRRAAAAAIGGVLALAAMLPAAALTAADPAAADGLVAQAVAYEHGEGVPKDQPRAAALYCEAARAGNVDAMYDLAWMYANGRGIAKDDALAAFFFSRAAREGHAQAREMLKFIGADQAVYPECMLPPLPAARPDVAVDAATALEAGIYADLPPDKRRIADMVVEAAPRYAIDPRLALAIVAAESNFQPDARSPKDARGVMQLIAATAARFNVRNRRDVVDNLQGGLAYLRWLLAYYEGRVELVVAAYNAGEAAVDRYQGVPPYAETRAYVQRVQGMFPDEWQPYDPSITDSSVIVVRAADAQ